VIAIMSTATGAHKVIVVAVDASDNAKDAFDCTYTWCTAVIITVVFRDLCCRPHCTGAHPIDGGTSTVQVPRVHDLDA